MNQLNQWLIYINLQIRLIWFSSLVHWLHLKMKQKISSEYSVKYPFDLQSYCMTSEDLMHESYESCPWHFGNLFEDSRPQSPFIAAQITNTLFFNELFQWINSVMDRTGLVHSWLQLHLQYINYLYFQFKKLLSDFRRLITLMMLLQSLWSLNALVTIYYSLTVQIINSKLFQWIGWFIHVYDLSGSTTDCVALEQTISGE